MRNCSNGTGNKTNLKGRVKEIRSASLSELPQALVKARIARGLSVEQLAGVLGWKASQLRSYEESEYEKAPFSLVVEAATVLCVRVESRVILEKMEKIPTAKELLREVTRITGAEDEVRRGRRDIFRFLGLQQVDAPEKAPARIYLVRSRLARSLRQPKRAS